MCPNSNATIPGDYGQWVSGRSRYYKFYDLARSRDDASDICSADGATLVSIDSITHWGQIWSHIYSEIRLCYRCQAATALDT